MLDSALHAVAAAHVDVVVHAHRVAGQAQRARRLVGKLRHLDRGPDIEDAGARVPLRRDAEGLDRHGGAAAPDRAEGDPVLGACERLLHRSPDELAVVEQVRAVRWVHERRSRRERRLGIDHVRQRLVFDLDPLRRVLGERARIGDDRRHPFAGIAHHAPRERETRHLGRVHPDRKRIGVRAEFLPGQYVEHARRGARRVGLDRNDARGCVGRRDERHVLHPGKRDVGDKAAAAGDETRMLLRAALRADVTEARHGARCFPLLG